MSDQSASPRSEHSADGSADPSFLDWQLPSSPDSWERYVYNPDVYWGGFPPEAAGGASMFAGAPWALGPWTKHEGNPVLRPSPGGWDPGSYGGGVHNGSVVVHDGAFHYVYRGWRPIDIALASPVDYICDIGLAVSDDGVHFVKDVAASPFFRTGADRAYSFEDVCLVRQDDTYFLFCNRWNWDRVDDPRDSGIFLATSTDLRTWEKHGLVFPRASRIHRNPVVIQDPHNNAVRVGGQYVMYVNDGLLGVSDDLLHWESHEIDARWPGGEHCVAMTGHATDRPDDIVVFTGGHHSGHFYAIGEVLFSRADPATPLEWLPRPVLAADPAVPYESGYSADEPGVRVSPFRDCIFFNGLTRHDGTWWLYYGGSEYYTCLATAPAVAGVPRDPH
jgi:predicted GH43/DUF377 family glycosyl hydrolase